MNTDPKTLSVPEAGQIYFGMGRDAAYNAAKRGDLPVIRFGRLLRVSIPALERMLEAQVIQGAETARST
ncbi:MAG: helix-turn-helix domain-containing protein [Alphaproteobacteria bacterium]|jgi:hypothetical protein|nr:helix-turn-helix domain-containing protein [Alphaproteobacteria bacterium]MBT6108632.1 helix-turn-helix domain-containing protein [Rhodospirillales bacterium]